MGDDGDDDDYKGEKIQCIDLPGVYSLSPYTLEETITRDFIINENPDVFGVS